MNEHSTLNAINSLKSPSTGAMASDSAPVPSDVVNMLPSSAPPVPVSAINITSWASAPALNSSMNRWVACTE